MHVDEPIMGDLRSMTESPGQRAALRVTSQAKPRPPHPSKCIVIHGTIAGLKGVILLDSGSSINAIGPSFATVAKIQVFPLEKPVGLQLGCVGSRSKINFGTEQVLTIGTATFPVYFDVVNIDHYDIVLGIPFMKMNRVTLDFERNVFRVGTETIVPLKGEEDIQKMKRRGDKPAPKKGNGSK